MVKTKKRIKKSDKIIPTDKQELGRRIIMSNKYGEILFDGGSRSGKTFLILICLILFCITYPGLRVLITRQVFAHARASLWDQTLIPLLQKLKIPHNIDKSRFVISLGKGSEIWLGGLDTKERADKILGQEYAIVFFNEAVEIPQSTRDVVKTRLAQNIPGLMNFMIYDCNPRQPTHYLYKEFYVENDKTKKTLKFLPEDNRENLPAGYIENILDKLPEDKKARFRKGEWAYLPGRVHPNISELNIINVEKNIYKFYDDIAVGVDWGLHMSACIWGFKITEEKIQAYLIHEIIILGGVTSDLINELNKVYGIREEGHMVYCDHEPDRIAEMQSAGYNAKPAYKEIGAGDSSVNDTELFFDSACKNTFQSMINLVHPEDPKGEGYIYGKHVKENDHEADASRYCIHGWRMDNNIHSGEHIILKRSVI